LYLLIFCIIFFLYAQFILRKTDKKSLWVASVLIRISSICCMFSIYIFINFIMDSIFFIVIFSPLIGILPITVLLIFFLNKWRLRRKTTF
jgi:hypothetical protein